MPPDTLRLLEPIVAAAVDIDPEDPEQVAAALPRLSPLTGAVLASEPLVGPHWFRTRRPNQWEVAEAVHRILDELEALSLAPSEPEGPTSPHHQPRVP